MLRTVDMDFGLGWSPDSRQIAFANGTLPGFDSELDSRIEIMRADGTHVRSLAMPSLQAGTPAWSPDGTRIAVAGGNGLYVVELASGRFARVSHGWFASNPVAPAWSPDGTRLSYVDGFGLEVIDVRAHVLHTVVALDGGGFGDGSSWSRTGEIVFSLGGGENRGIRRVRPDGRGLTWVTPL